MSAKRLSNEAFVVYDTRLVARVAACFLDLSAVFFFTICSL